MNDPLTPRAQELLEEIMAGDRSREDELVQRFAREEPAFLARLHELDQVRALLDETAEDALQTMSDARDWRGAPGEDGMERSVRLDPGRRGPLYLLRPTLIAGLAAAAVALLVWLGGEQGDPSPPEPLYMGEKSLSVLQPRGRVSSYAPIRWTGQLPPGGEFHVILRDATGPGPSGKLLLEIHTQASSWTPSAAELAQLTERITIEIRLLGGDGGELERVQEEAER